MFKATQAKYDYLLSEIAALRVSQSATAGQLSDLVTLLAEVVRRVREILATIKLQGEHAEKPVKLLYPDSTFYPDVPPFYPVPAHSSQITNQLASEGLSFNLFEEVPLGDAEGYSLEELSLDEVEPGQVTEF